MTQPELHDLAAAYALNALDPEDRWTYERHLDECERCRDEVASLRDAASELAYVAEGPAPPPQLRERILREARADGSAEVIPLRRRWLVPALGAVAVAAACVAVGLGLWANSLRDQAPGRVVEVQGQDAAGNLIVSGDEGTLVVCLDEAPAGKTYEAWVIEAETPRPAGLFPGGCQSVPLEEPVSSGDTVAVTLEDEGGAAAPTSDVLLSGRV